ncbi:MAG: glutamate racemase [Candidatus Uhrbacteria bacterium]
MLGVFDSGFGGLTVLRAIHDRLPDVSTVYLGDNARAPYGTRSHEEVFAFALEGVRELFRRGCPLVIFACNTASAQALRQIQRTILPVEFPDRRVLGVIRPTAEEIVSMSATKHIGVFATPATVLSGAYVREISSQFLISNFQFPRPVITQVACPGRLTILIEAGEDKSPEAESIVASCCQELLAADPLVDTVLLGCTHYPLVKPLFDKYLRNNDIPLPTLSVGSKVDRRVVSQGTIVADKLVDYLARHSDVDDRIDRAGSRQYLTTKSDDGLSSLASRFYGKTVHFETVTL